MPPPREYRRNYGEYKSVRNAAWQVLIDFGVREAPVNVVAIAVRAGVRVVRDSEVGELAPGEDGLSVHDGSRWYIVYDDRMTRSHSRFTIAHELGHIFLSHAARSGYRTDSPRRRSARHEYEADLFASRLLMPSCVIWGMGLRSAEEIERAFCVSRIAARARAARMSVLYKRGKFLNSEKERRVFANFAEYIAHSRHT